MPEIKLGALSARGKTFVREYLLDFNGTRAAVAAGYSEKTAHVAASRLLRNAKVQEAIEKQQEKRLERLGISADRVLRELARLSFADPRKFFNDDGSAKNITELDEETAAAIAGLEVTELKDEDGESYGYTKKFRLADKGVNLERLARHLGLLGSKSETPPTMGPVTINVVYQQAQTRAPNTQTRSECNCEACQLVRRTVNIDEPSAISRFSPQSEG